MELAANITLAALVQQVLVGLSRTTILFIVASGLSLVLGVLRIPNVAHGSLYMTGAFVTYTVATLFGQSTLGFWLALIVAPLVVALLSFIAERGLFCHLYEREHMMLLLFTFAFSLVIGDLVKLIWGSDYRSLVAPLFLQGSFSISGFPFPRYNLFLLVIGPLVAAGLWFLTNKTKIGKIARAAAVDREMVGAIGINVSWVFAARICYRLLSGGTGRRAGGPYPEYHPGHGPRHHHRGVFDCHHRWAGQYLGGAAGGIDFRPDRFDRDSVMAAVCDRLPLRGGGHRAAFSPARAAQINLVERTFV